MNKKHMVIVGGGFAGIAAALACAERLVKHVTITLITATPHFEYHAALYRLVTGSSSTEVCIPLHEIFAGKNVEVVEDRITDLDRDGKVVVGSSGVRYSYDYLILALGSETNYFGVPGLKEYSYGMKSIAEALRLKEHISDVLLTCKIDDANKTDQVCNANFVVIGAGATGVEMAGQLIVYARELAKEHGLDPALVSVELIEGAGKIIPSLPARFTDRIEHHLRGLGVNIFLNRMIEREEIEGIYLGDMSMKARTVIWTAGVKANAVYERWKLPINKQGKVEVDEHLRLHFDPDVFIAGDGAATKYSGWAQTAVYDGEHIERVVESDLKQKSMPVYDPPPPMNAIPAGPQWAAILWGNKRFYGRIGWWLRRLADLRSFLGILSPIKAWKVFKNGSSICDNCGICSVEKHSAPHEA
ncbi:MAG: hypothetical protein A2942_04560 [Candidatus Lloydbacteria bacterium RIFCSPLOWO2_01_FULL_50_20]|uniref:FAD/NAD(P)-binding domain-containing protein n=1 Tax=Candidatus Lloydbacteria bacterium RIFCSPLOWO2_01_FULL_50_20 TaxID=1798665 RepID=A0A1G2DJK9_9BACT|nr:MAG: hypothetical protein A3C13_02860 [Candidatus Lloydbacteria bacterium RIFCSPHIGHO2_02_FULL_50_11]OGZ13592.1 MAG: hypothetical protein A2942_04560 [Candidatus Lloydbacteria bacterium RIFCSPLOWO2_01_FULL_50_20]